MDAAQEDRPRRPESPEPGSGTLALLDRCGRCERALRSLDENEPCVICGVPLCATCRDGYGFCPHAGAAEWQVRMETAMTPEERARVLATLAPIADQQARRRAGH